MIKIKISHQIELDTGEIPNSLFRLISKDLTLKNPEYIQAKSRGRSTHGKPEYLKLYLFEEGKLVLPRGYGKQLMQRFKETHTPFEWDDRRLALPSVEFGSKIKVRDYQADAVAELVKHRQGGVVAGCGAGKTMIMLEAMARIGQPSLWVTHTHELLEQVIERATSVFDIRKEEIGVIAAGKCTIGEKMTVALVQTLAKADLDLITDKFGAVYIDEGHHISAKSFFFPISMFPAYTRIWASATPDRSDGLTEMVFAGAGPILHTVDQSKVPTIIPELKVIETDYSQFYESYVELIGNLINDPRRNDLIVRIITEEAPNNYSLVLSDRVEHLEILQRMLQAALPHMTIEILTGSMKKKERAEVMERVRNKQVDILLATQLAREGLDVIHLNRLFLVTPKKAAGAVQQECGRIMRPAPGKQDCIVFDFWDLKNPFLKSQFWKRREVYRKIGMDWPPKQTQEVSSK